jgi:hypothetical protein
MMPHVGFSFWFDSAEIAQAVAAKFEPGKIVLGEFIERVQALASSSLLDRLPI